MDLNGDILDPNAGSRVLRVFLVGLVIGASAGVIIGGLAAMERLGNG